MRGGLLRFEDTVRHHQEEELGKLGQTVGRYIDLVSELYEREVVTQEFHARVAEWAAENGADVGNAVRNPTESVPERVLAPIRKDLGLRKDLTLKTNTRKGN